MNAIKRRIVTLILAVLAVVCFTGFTVTFTAFAKTTEITEGKTEVYQLAPENQSLLESFVIKTPNGKLIVVDGGIAGYGKESATYLPSALRAIAGVKDGEYFEVEGWFISHMHNDHYHELSKMLTEYNENSNYVINNFYFDFPEKTYRCSDYDVTDFNEFIASLNNYATVRGIKTEDVDFYDEINGAVINADAIKEGLEIVIDGVRFEILQTWTAGDGQVNNNSTIMRMWFDGQSMLFLNDAAVDAGVRLLNTYGADYLKSDIVQLAHHGQNGVALNVYEAISANVRCWACPTWVWNDSTTDNYQTDTVRTWFGMEREASDAVIDKTTDIVAGMYDAYPTDPTSVEDWTAVLSQMKLTVPNVKAYDSGKDFTMIDGAYIRLTEGTTGLRFAARLATVDTEAKYGFVIVPKSYLTKNNITEDYIPRLIDIYGENNLIITTCNPINGNEINAGPHYVIYSSITNVLYKNMNLDFVGIGYCLKDGEYTYASFSDIESVGANVYDVAIKAYNDYSYQDVNLFDEQELAVIKGFVKAGINQKAGVSEEDNATTEPVLTHEFTEENLSLNYGESGKVTLNSVFPKDAVTYEYDENIISLQDGVVTSKAVGSTDIVAKCYDKTATVGVTVGIEDGYLATYENDGYNGSAVINDRVYRQAKSVTSEVVDSYTDYYGFKEESVLKINITASSSGIADFVLNLPKLIDKTKGATIKFCVASTSATALYFRLEGEKDVIDAANYNSATKRPFLNATQRDNVLNKWQIVYIGYNGAVDNFDRIEALFAGASANSESVIYVAFVQEGNTLSTLNAEMENSIVPTLVAKLSGKEVANFDSAMYEKLITTDASYYFESYSVTYLEEYTDGSGATEKGVIRLFGTTNSVNSTGLFKIKLPKSHSGVYTMRMLNAETSDIPTNIVYSKSSGASGWLTYFGTSGITNKWTDKTITETDGYDGSYIKFGASSGGHTFDIYISLIIDGDSIVKEELANELNGIELATFDSVNYEKLVSRHTTYTPKDYVIEYLESFTDDYGVTEHGVLRLKGTNTTGNTGFFVITLPKAHSGIVTVKIMAKQTDTLSANIIFPYTGTASGNAHYFSHSSIIGKWSNKTINYNKEGNDNSYIVFGGNGAGGINDLYISIVVDGDENALKTYEKNKYSAIIAKTLTEGYYADFTSGDYKYLLSNSFPASGEDHYDYNFVTQKAVSVTGTYLSAYEGETDVLKVHTVKATGSSFRMYLPKTITGNKITLKFRIASTDENGNALSTAQYVAVKQIGKWSGGDIKYWAVASNLDTWITVTLTSDSFTNTDEIWFAIWGGSSGAITDIYFSYIQ